MGYYISRVIQKSFSSVVAAVVVFLFLFCYYVFFALLFCTFVIGFCSGDLCNRYLFSLFIGSWSDFDSLSDFSFRETSASLCWLLFLSGGSAMVLRPFKIRALFMCPFYFNYRFMRPLLRGPCHFLTHFLLFGCILCIVISVSSLLSGRPPIFRCFNSM